MPQASAALRILQVAAPARTGGLESVLLELSTGLRGRGHDVQVAAVLSPRDSEEHPVVSALRQRGVPVHALVVESRDYLGERRAIRSIMRRMNAQVLHTHGFRPDVIDGGLARSEGAARVTTLHGFVGGSRRGRFYEWLQIQAARRAGAVVAVSAPIADRLARHGIRKQVHLIPNAVASVTDALARDEARALLGLPASGFIVGWVGRVSHEKGPDLFVEALAGVPGIAGVVVGDGPMREDILQRAATLGLTPRFFAPGLVPSASRYLAAFDCVALTSRTEGTPMILLEAMLAGVPVIATAVGGVPQVVGDTEAILCGLEVTSIVTALRDAAADAVSLKRRAAAALHRVQSSFSAHRWLDHHEQLYFDVLL